jgi:hypothetical protein
LVVHQIRTGIDLECPPRRCTRRKFSGIGLIAGVGHDWWISDRWSVGILARLVYANMHVTGAPYTGKPGGTPTERDTVISPSLEASFTWH